MPVYGGGKAKLGPEIYRVIQKWENKLNWTGDFFEPFCGLLGVGIIAAEDGRRVLACDANKDIILMFRKLQRGWKPPQTCSRKKYEQLKNSGAHSAERGFIGIACAYSGIFFAGYRIKAGQRNFFREFRHQLLQMVPILKRIKFLSPGDYREFEPNGLTIYCDPPYKDNSLKSEYFDNFDHDEFWETMRRWSKNNLVFISEYRAPRDFKSIWQRKMNSTFNHRVAGRTEKLFIYRPRLKE